MFSQILEIHGIILMAYLSVATKNLLYGIPTKYGIAVLSYDYIHICEFGWRPNTHEYIK